MFVFYFAIISNITPPVALAAYAASSIADSEPNKTGFAAMKLGILAFIVPYAFMYDKGVILHGGLTANLAAIGGGCAAIFAMGFAMMAYIRNKITGWQRLVFIAAGFLCFFPVLVIKGIGIAAVLGGYLLFRGKPKNTLNQNGV